MKVRSKHEECFSSRKRLEAIVDRNYPSWTVKVQIVPLEDAATYRFDPFGLTKVWPHKDYPMVAIGNLVLDRNPENYFAEVEQAAFSPSNVEKFPAKRNF
ncbi:MAG: catalase [Hormoscilla sp. GM7CHS1pb]|nr:catalase [Hormoscilla sp. GM7CHS1pb]